MPNEVDSLDEPVTPPENNFRRRSSAPFLRSGFGASTVGLIGIVVVAALLLVVPIPNARHHRLLTGLLNLGHVPLFGLLTFVALRTLGRKVWVLALMTALAAGGELIQYLSPSRSVDWADFAHGVVGIVVAWIIMSPWPTWFRALASVALLAFPIGSLGPGMADSIYGHRQFPVLVDFSSPGQERRWRTRQAKIERVRAEQRWVGRLTFRAGESNPFPNAEFVPLVADWSGYDTLEIEFDAPQPISLQVTIRDQRSELGYRERYNGFGQYPIGRHVVQVPLETIRKGPATREIDLERMDSINLFISAEAAPAEIYLRRIELTRRAN